MNENAIFMCNMSTWRHPYYKRYKTEDKRGFVNVGNSGTVGDCLYANVMKVKEDLEELFSIFDCKKICVSMIETDDASETMHYIEKKKAVL